MCGSLHGFGLEQKSEGRPQGRLVPRHGSGAGIFETSCGCNSGWVRAWKASQRMPFISLSQPHLCAPSSSHAEVAECW